MVDIGNVVFPRRLLKRFILLYKELPCLWNRECATYKNKQKRHDAVTKLTELVQEYDSTATRVHVLRKIESLRACVRREHKRVVESRQAAHTADDIYTPQLWYYDIFSFVFPPDDMGNSKTKSDNVSHETDIQSDNEEDNDEILGDEEPNYDNQSYQIEYGVNNMVEADNPSGSKRYFDDDQNKTPKRQWTGIEDEYDAIGVNVAAKLRNLPPNMRILAEKLINDVLFQAQLNGLNSSTVITTTDPFKQDNV